MGRILTLTGPPGNGKSAIASKLLELGGFSLVVSYTTRKQRPTDLPGEYSYIRQPDFDNFSKRDKFLWQANVRGFEYGTMRNSIDFALDKTDITSIMILVPEVLKTLRGYAKRHGRTDDFLHVLIETNKEVVLDRLKDQDQNEVMKRINDGRNWPQEMADAGVPCKVVQNNGDIGETVLEIIRTLIR